MWRFFLFCAQPSSLLRAGPILLGLSVLFFSCAPLTRQRGKEISPPKGVDVEDIFLELDPPSGVVAWGETLFVQLRAGLKGEQKYPVQVAVSKAPAWIWTNLNPAILAPQQTGKLAISPFLGEAELGSAEIYLEARAYGTDRPREFRFSIEVVRQSGQFVQVLTAPVSQGCRNACGRVSGASGQLAVDFYDLILEQGQKCDDRTPLPSSQRINRAPYRISDDGFGFGRACRVALVVAPAGEYNLVNIRLPGAKAERGEVLLKLRNVQSIWLSPDNTVALAVSGSSLLPYDVLTGRLLGETCRISGALTGVLLTGGTLLTATADRSCNWTIQ
ncbi:MAG: hypothetical protein V1784_09810 [bacterium]